MRAQGGVPVQWPFGNCRYQTEHRAFRRRREGKQSAEAVRKIDALDDTLSTGSRSSLRAFAACTATKNAAKSLTSRRFHGCGGAQPLSLRQSFQLLCDSQS